MPSLRVSRSLHAIVHLYLSTSGKQGDSRTSFRVLPDCARDRQTAFRGALEVVTKLSQCVNVFQASKLPLLLFLGTLLDQAAPRKGGRPFVFNSLNVNDTAMRRKIIRTLYDVYAFDMRLELDEPVMSSRIPLLLVRYTTPEERQMIARWVRQTFHLDINWYTDDINENDDQFFSRIRGRYR